MNMHPILAESVLNALPCIVLIKELYQNKARWVWANDACARLAGFKNGEQSLGIYDEEMRCDASNYAETFLHIDNTVLTGKALKTIDIYTYADGEKHLLWGEKKYCMTLQNQTP
jgi:hypothetical protein